MEKLKSEEQKILSQFESRISEIKKWKTKQLKEEIVAEVKKAGYCTGEDWHVYYSAEAIFESLQEKIWYSGLTEQQIEYISSWSWAAFFGGFIFTLGSKLYLWSLGFFIPFFNLFLIFYLGKNGRRLSYRKGWQGFIAFKKRQNSLAWITGILWVFVIGSQLLIRILLTPSS